MRPPQKTLFQVFEDNNYFTDKFQRFKFVINDRWDGYDEVSYRIYHFSKYFSDKSLTPFEAKEITKVNRNHYDYTIFHHLYNSKLFGNDVRVLHSEAEFKKLRIVSYPESYYSDTPELKGKDKEAAFATIFSEAKQATVTHTAKLCQKFFDPCSPAQIFELLSAQESKKGETPLHFAIEKCPTSDAKRCEEYFKPIVTALSKLDEKPVGEIFHQQNHDGQNILHFIARFLGFPHLLFLKKILPDSLITPDKSGETPLHLALKNHYPLLANDFLTTLVASTSSREEKEKKLDEMTQLSDTLTALDYNNQENLVILACRAKGYAFLKNLPLPYFQSTLPKRDNTGKNPFHYAASDAKLFEILLSRCQDCKETKIADLLKVRDNQGRSVLKTAVLANAGPDILKKIISNLLPKIPSHIENQKNAFYYAARLGDNGFMKELCEKYNTGDKEGKPTLGCCLLYKNQNQRSCAIETACKHADMDMIMYLFSQLNQDDIFALALEPSQLDKMISAANRILRYLLMYFEDS